MKRYMYLFKMVQQFLYTGNTTRLSGASVACYCFTFTVYSSSHQLHPLALAVLYSFMPINIASPNL